MRVAKLLMKIANGLADFTIGGIIYFSSVCLVISLVVVYFKLSGFVEGQPMLFDLETPPWTGLLIFQSICVAFLCIGFFLRHKLHGAASKCNTEQYHAASYNMSGGLHATMEACYACHWYWVTNSGFVLL